MKSLKKRIVMVGFVLMGIWVPRLCGADIVYLKNGRKLEGEVKRTSEGLWIEGGLFEEKEIERIEKGPSPAGKKENQPWYNEILNKVGIKTETEKPGSGRVPQKNLPQPSAMDPALQPGTVQVAPMGLPFLTPQAQPQPGYGQDFSAMIQQAQQLQSQAQMQQMMMMQEMMKAEEGYPGESSAGSAGKVSAPKVESYDYALPDYQKKGKAGGYDDHDSGTQKRSGGKRFKTMDIDEYGNVSWE